MPDFFDPAKRRSVALFAALGLIAALDGATSRALASHGDVDQQQTSVSFPFCDGITGQTFTPLVDNIVGFDLNFAAAATYTFRISELATGAVVATVPSLAVAAGIQQIDLAAETPLDPSTRYFLSLTLESGTCSLQVKSLNPYPSGSAMRFGVEDASLDLWFRTRFTPSDDNDGDGVTNASDLCPGTPTGKGVDPSGCADVQVDADADGACTPGAVSPGPSDCVGSDNCPTVSNRGQYNSDADAFGDACDADAVDEAQTVVDAYQGGIGTPWGQTFTPDAANLASFELPRCDPGFLRGTATVEIRAGGVAGATLVTIPNVPLSRYNAAAPLVGIPNGPLPLTPGARYAIVVTAQSATCFPEISFNRYADTRGQAVFNGVEGLFDRDLAFRTFFSADFACGDDTVQANEQCDDGDAVGGDGCSSTCQTESCGNNIVDAGETCDDGNAVDGDCCSASCQLEPTTTVCRPPVASCDATEHCTGLTRFCPADAVEPAGTSCESDDDACTVDECDASGTCTHTGEPCPDPTATPTPPPTETPELPTPTATETPEPRTPTATATDPPTPTATAPPAPTETPEPPPTAVPTDPPPAAPTNTAKPTMTPKPTNTPKPTATAKRTPTPKPTNTPKPTRTPR